MPSSINVRFDNFVYSFDMLPTIRTIGNAIIQLHLGDAINLLQSLNKQLENEKKDYENIQIERLEYKHFDIPF